MPSLHIIRDTREQQPWKFEGFDASLSDETITTGDYTLAELCDHDERNDTYHPNYAIERKSTQDFVSSITSGRERFKEEIKRASEWESPLSVYVEASKRDFGKRGSALRYVNIQPTHVFGTVDDWERYYNVDFRFVGTRKRAQQKAYADLRNQLRANLVD
jgi:ERCC4-type nuclease